MEPLNISVPKSESLPPNALASLTDGSEDRTDSFHGAGATHSDVETGSSTVPSASALLADPELVRRLDLHSLEAVVEMKVCRFLDQLGSYYPENLHELIMRKVEKPLLGQILKRVGGNQVHAARILGINRNTLRKKIKLYGF